MKQHAPPDAEESIPEPQVASVLAAPSPKELQQMQLDDGAISLLLTAVPKQRGPLAML